MKSNMIMVVLLITVGVAVSLQAGKRPTADANLSNVPVQKEYPRDFESVWTATIAVLSQRGDPIVHSDKTSGVITTDYKAEEGDWHHKFGLLLAKKGDAVTNVSVTCTVQKMSKSKFVGKYGKWEDKKSDGTRESQLLSEIGQRLQP
ncbi:MAG: hypothetical protein ABSH01_13120 [Terriglobia bacterium]|jgi:hypothetical protein